MRAAFQRLRDIGLLDVVPYKGASATLISLASVHQMIHLRTALESWIIREGKTECVVSILSKHLNAGLTRMGNLIRENHRGYFALIFNAEAANDASLPPLYGGTVDDPIPVYAESDEILEALFPKGKTIFLMCQSGGRVNNMMKLLSARGWDMSKVYNIGGMAHYAGAEYRDIVTDTPEIAITAACAFEGLTRAAPK